MAFAKQTAKKTAELDKRKHDEGLLIREYQSLANKKDRQSVNRRSSIAGFFIRQYQPLAMQMVSKLIAQEPWQDQRRADLIQSANIGIIKAIDQFDTGRDLVLMTFLHHKIRGELTTESRREARHVSMREPMGDEPPKTPSRKKHPKLTSFDAGPQNAAQIEKEMDPNYAEPLRTDPERRIRDMQSVVDAVETLKTMYPRTDEIGWRIIMFFDDVARSIDENRSVDLQINPGVIQEALQITKHEASRALQRIRLFLANEKKTVDRKKTGSYPVKGNKGSIEEKIPKTAPTSSAPPLLPPPNPAPKSETGKPYTLWLFGEPVCLKKPPSPKKTTLHPTY